MSWSIIAAWASIIIAIMLLLILRHPTCASCVAWMCCRMSNSIKHVWACPDLSFDRLVLYAFLHSLRSMFSPSRPLQLWFEAACETSFALDIYAVQSTQKAVEGAICLSVRYVTQNTEVREDKILLRAYPESRAYGTGVGARRGHCFFIASMLLLVIRHLTCASCVAWMCCRMSSSIKHVWACPAWACPDLSFDRLGLYAFLHSLRSNFSPSRPLQLWFNCLSVCLSVCPVVVDETKNMARAYGTGVGARRGH